MIKFKITQLTAAAIMSLVVTLLAGCQSTKDYGYARPFDFQDKSKLKHNYSKEKEFRKNYDELVNLGDDASLKKAAVERNQIVGELLYVIEAAHGQFERNSRALKSGTDFFGDVAILSVNAVGTVTGTAETKSILHAISGGIEGVQLAANKRFLADQALEAIQVQMRATMKARKAVIIENMKKEIKDYSLEMGLSDVVSYYYDGTITRALQNMVKSATKNEKDAEDLILKVRGASLATDDADKK